MQNIVALEQGNSNIYAGRILTKKELAGRISREKLLIGP